MLVRLVELRRVDFVKKGKRDNNLHGSWHPQNSCDKQDEVALGARWAR